MAHRTLAVQVLATAALAVAFVACADTARDPITGPASSPQAPSAAKLSGEEVFRGVAFGEGRVGAKLPEIWTHISTDDPAWTPEQRNQAKALKSRLVSDMQRLDASFFPRFGEAMQSGDHMRVADAMDESAKLFRSAVEQENGSPLGSKGSPGSETGTCITLAVAGNVVAVVNLAGAWNVAVYANAVYNENYFWGSKEAQIAYVDGASNNSLARDQVVAMIADRLYVE